MNKISLLALFMAILGISQANAFVCEIYGIPEDVDIDKVSKRDFIKLVEYDHVGVSPTANNRCLVTDLDNPHVFAGGEEIHRKTKERVEAEQAKYKAKHGKDLVLVHSCWYWNPFCPDRGMIKDAIRSAHDKAQGILNR